jgi:transposase
MDAEELRNLPVDALVSIIPAQRGRIAELTALVESQAATIASQSSMIAQLEKRLAELEDKLGKPPKTPDNSSPSSGQKPNLPEREHKGRKGRP